MSEEPRPLPLTKDRGREDGVLDLNAFRASKGEAAADLVACECGSVWFRPEGITLDAATGRPIDYAHPVACIECGRSVGTR